MKVTSQVTRRARITGTIFPEELLAFVRQTLEIPAEAEIHFLACDDESSACVTSAHPLSFTAVWEEQAPATPERALPMRAVTPVEVSTEPHG